MNAQRCVSCFRPWLAPADDQGACPFCGGAGLELRPPVRPSRPPAPTWLPAAPLATWLRERVVEVGSASAVADTLQVDAAWLGRIIHGKVDTLSLDRIDTYLVRLDATYMLGLLYPLEDCDPVAA